jgi:hypothetical protein
MRKSGHHGFAMLFAIALISLTGMAVTEITLTLTADARRTTRLAEDAQLRQLLLAGADFAVAHPQAGHYDVPVPEEVGGKVSIDVHSPDAADVEAAVMRRQQREHLTFSQENGEREIAQSILQN